MDSGVNVAPAPFLSLMPAGWYQAEFEAAAQDEDSVERMCALRRIFNFITSVAPSAKWSSDEEATVSTIGKSSFTPATNRPG